MSLESLRTQFPWPDTRPELKFDPHGWCRPEHRDVLKGRLHSNTRLIIELGSWLGQSTRLLLAMAPNATVVCVDTWKGSSDMLGNPEAEQRLSMLYDQFLANQWEWRQRVIPLQLDSRDGLREVKAHGLTPDLVFLDTEHTTAHVIEELELAHALFPSAMINGDDWGWPDVRAAVEQFATAHPEYRPVGKGNAWRLEVAR